MPEVAFAMMEIVPVGAMVVTVALRVPFGVRLSLAQEEML